MPIVYATLNDPSDNPLARAYVEARLAVESETHTYRPGDEVSLLARSSTYTAANGRWELNLTPNDDITPSGTVYEIIEAPQVGRTRVSYIVVPDGAGPYWLEDLLVDPPASLPPSGIGDHLTDITGAHSASSISFTPTGTIGSTNVQAAIVEAATEGGGGGGVPGSSPLYVGPDAPDGPPDTYLWIETGLGGGSDFTFWIEDGT